MECQSCKSKNRIIPKKTLSYFAVSIFSSVLSVVVFLVPFFILTAALIRLPYVLSEITFSILILLFMALGYFLAKYVKRVVMSTWNWWFGNFVLAEATKDIPEFD